MLWANSVLVPNKYFSLTANLTLKQQDKKMQILEIKNKCFVYRRKNPFYTKDLIYFQHFPVFRCRSKMKRTTASDLVSTIDNPRENIRKNLPKCLNHLKRRRKLHKNTAKTERCFESWLRQRPSGHPTATTNGSFYYDIFTFGNYHIIVTQFEKSLV